MRMFIRHFHCLLSLRAFLICYSLVLTCSKTTGTKDLLDGQFITADTSPVDLLAPITKSSNSKTPQFAWSSRTGAKSYLLEVSANSDLSSPILSHAQTATSYTLSNSDLNGISQLDAVAYYWRVSTSYFDATRGKVASSIGIFFVSDTAVLYVNGAYTGSDLIGNKTAPYRNIRDAISVADTLRGNAANVSYQILVAKGTYNEEINLKPGISIRGGYEATNWTRNIASNVTTISTSTDTTIRAGGSITSTYTATTLVEGFTINGGNTSLTNYAIYLNGASPTISQNTINGGPAGSNASTYAIYNGSGANGIINNNTIIGGAGGDYACVFGVANISSSPTIAGNLIMGGRSYGNITPGSACSNPLIAGNVCVTFGIYNSSSSPVIVNNTISNGAISPGAGFCISYGIYISVGNPTIRDNIIFSSAIASGANGRYGIYEATAATSDPAVVNNNNFFDNPSPGGFYRDGSGTAVTDMVTAVSTGAGSNTLGNFGNVNIDNSTNQLFVNAPVQMAITMGAGTATTIVTQNSCPSFVTNEYIEYNNDGIARKITACAGGATVTFTPALSSASVSGMPVTLWGTNNTNLKQDYHLKTASATICNVLFGGLNLSSILSTDLDFVSRTANLAGLPCTLTAPSNTQGQGWSMGAYEKD